MTHVFDNSFLQVVPPLLALFCSAFKHSCARVGLTSLTQLCFVQLLEAHPVDQFVCREVLNQAPSFYKKKESTGKLIVNNEFSNHSDKI